MADLIDRDLTIHELEAFRESCIANIMRMSFDDITDVVKDIPAVNRWISVEDALPKSSEDVLVWFEYFRYGEYNCMYQTYNIGNYFAKHDSWMVGHETGWQKLRVIAWMPLPEPPESEV